MYHPSDYEAPEIELTDHLISPDIGFEAITLGRTSKYTPEMARKLYDYFNIPLKIKKKIPMKVSHSMVNVEIEVDNYLPTVSGFCRMQGIGRATFYRWCVKHQQFRDIASWGKIVIEEMISQKLFEGRADSGSVVALNQIMHKYDKDLMELPSVALDSPDDEDKTEQIPPKKKGYDISEIDKYRNKAAIETTAVEVKDGKEKSVQVSQETKDI